MVAKTRFKKHLVIGIMALLLFVVIIPQVGGKSREIIYVDDDNTSGPWDGTLEHPFQYIRDGVSATNPGDTVFVFNGSYYEYDLYIDTSISLLGEDRENTFLDGSFYENVITVTADTVTISGFTIRNSGDLGADSGIMLLSDYNTITDNIITDNGGFVAYEQPGAGVFLYQSSHNTIRDNDISQNEYYNVYLYTYCYYNEIHDNTINENAYHHNVAFYLSDNNNFTGNTVISSYRTAVILWESSDNNVSDNIINDHYYGAITLGEYSNNNDVFHNSIFEGSIYIVTSSFNTLVGNDVSWDLHTGITIHSSSTGNTLINNNVSFCNRGISITSNGNTFYHNRLFHNNQNADDYGTNIWDDDYPSGGNYWDDYMGVDNFSGPEQNIPGSDGIGDTPYPIPGGGNVDRYPLMGQVPEADIVYVDDDYNESTPGWGVDHFDDIQTGIDAVVEHGIVYVHNGVYDTNILIEKTINVLGEDRNETIINGLGVSSVVEIIEGVNNVTISGFNIRNSGSYVFDAGMRIDSDHNDIVGNRITQNNAHGIYLYQCLGNLIADNMIDNNFGYPSNAISFEYATENDIVDNIIVDNYNGIAVQYYSDLNTFTGNTISGQLVDGLSLWRSSDTTVSDNTISGNGFYGISIKDCHDNIISENRILSNGRTGIYFYLSANDNIITENDIGGNQEYGIWVDSYASSNGNQIFHNNFLNNTQNAGDNGHSNTWDDGYPSGGNYWSDYTGSDGNGDGIGDTPYPIPGSAGSQDLYPYMLPDGWLDPQNHPPYIPSNPHPQDGEIDVSISAVLSWTGGDPDGDPVTYDVYFGTENPPPLLVGNQTETSYTPDLEYSTLYFWKIVAWDNHSASAEGPVWEFTTEEESIPVPDLDCEGALSWTEIEPGATVEGEFIVENIGDPESLLDWEIDSYPEWGTWSFDPDSGEDLTPEDGPIIVEVDVVAPDEPETVFTGEVILVNSENPYDYCVIDVSLATPESQVSVHFHNQLYQRIRMLLSLRM